MKQIYISMELSFGEVMERLGLASRSGGIPIEELVQKVVDNYYHKKETEPMPIQWEERKRKPYWEQTCKVCGELGHTASRGIPQQVWCVNNHNWRWDQWNTSA